MAPCARRQAPSQRVRGLGFFAGFAIERLRGRVNESIMASKIEDYGIIGNTQTAALVSSAGSVDWLCAPRFDSDACFSALIGYDEHGQWTIRPTVGVRQRRQRYRGDTLILETDLECDG